MQQQTYRVDQAFYLFEAACRPCSPRMRRCCRWRCCPGSRGRSAAAATSDPHSAIVAASIDSACLAASVRAPRRHPWHIYCSTSALYTIARAQTLSRRDLGASYGGREIAHEMLGKKVKNQFQICLLVRLTFKSLNLKLKLGLNNKF